MYVKKIIKIFKFTKLDSNNDHFLQTKPESFLCSLEKPDKPNEDKNIS